MTTIGFCSDLPAKGTDPSPLPAQGADGDLGVSCNIFFNGVGQNTVVL